MKSIKIKGIGASSGVAVAKVFKLEEIKIDVNDAKISDIDAEIKLFEDAVKKSVFQIEQIKQKATKLKPEELEILEAHALLASDPDIAEDVKNMIRQQYNAVYSLKTVAKQRIQFMLDTQDEYWIARIADIKDVVSRISKNILNINILDLSSISEDVIIVADDLTPSDTAQLNSFVKGFATNVGSRTSHSAIMARSLEIPAILGLTNIVEQVKNGDVLAINGDSGQGVINPNEEELADFAQQYAHYVEGKKKLDEFLYKPAISADGRKVVLAANIGSVEDAEGAQKANADEIGLFRSEFLYMDASNWPTEDEQFNSYKKVLQTMAGKKVVVRTLDIGGDKTLKYYNFNKELNPFLGNRAIRLSLDKQEILATQLRALIRASEFGPIAIMFPMIATLNEFFAAKKVFNEVYEQLRFIYPKIAKKEEIKLGIMIEIPIAAVMANQFAHHVDFFSIGTNDLIQYSLAADRMNEKVSYLYQPLNPGILKLIKMTIDAGHRHNKWVGMCGEMAGDVNVVPILLGLGLDEFSMSASSITKVKQLISTLEYKKMHEIAQKVVNFETEHQVIKYLESLDLISPK
ncbi:Phosphoenolpyruvate-protein phosphotransferase [Mesomycoplasma conjunctivae]|uniref:Phosphoenolpyruvate-protein phosphotransferase n=1 Tax=Mesomycoplasma conjunctivae (strain ATCC 25834 / NCTC 10147 / HRC/581) TaxID=572263 RepID=C5J6J6_MESCH|nr:phosphoenolpyruvate--protein phosphotransferase [Mesomycoplasma conjunctivae]CAT05089.1 Phosphoenolpyruvate-protein phosphotransferase [Mesomycoplasma conjunctivae]VEU66254.1 Phosphoenolpyruvate-protein phosphotransferase [Mesomycoplasma conjunctivae]